MDAGEDLSISNIEIFTLNHDLLIERILQNAGIAFSSGFAPISRDLLCWDRQKFARSRRKIRLLKLHGSVDWYTVRFSPSGTAHVSVATNGDIEQARGPEQEVARLLNGGPEMLIGTFNKMLEYTMGIYADLFCAFRTALRRMDRLVVSGYSFGDKGVNASIAEWIRGASNRRVLIIAPNADDFRYTARGAIRRLFVDCQPRIATHDTKFEDVTWHEILAWSGSFV